MVNRRTFIVLALVILLSLAAPLLIRPPSRVLKDEKAITTPAVQRAMATAKIRMSADKKQTQVAHVKKGQVVELTVSGQTPRVVAVEGFSKGKPVEPGTPAFFTFIADNSQTFRVLSLEPAQTIGEVIAK